MINLNNYPKLKILLRYCYKKTVQNFYFFISPNNISGERLVNKTNNQKK